MLATSLRLTSRAKTTRSAPCSVQNLTACLLETDKTKDAIPLLEKLVANGEGTEYYQQACWYLALAYLQDHKEDKVMDVLDSHSNCNEINNTLKNLLIR